LKLASFQADGKDRIGYSPDGDSLVDLASAVALIGRSYDCPRTMIDLLEGGAAMWSLVREAADAGAKKPEALVSYPLSSVVWHPPVRRPLKVCCLALNNSANADRIVSGPKHPAIFVKAANALVGHEQAVVVKKHFGRVHPEPELAIVIGKTAKDIDAASAYDYVFGYTIHNDITSPTMRGEDTFNYRAIHPGKNGGDDIT
jgi:2-keto-4-pentenoate hydratase/2-oxohepta-3-ene-1,7-dioic acid hydratase in catechol pathway